MNRPHSTTKTTKRNRRDAEPTDVTLDGRPNWKLATALIWLLMFLAVFFAQPLPNADNYLRSDFWLFDVPHILGNPVAHGPHTGWKYLPQRLDLFAFGAFILAGAWGWGRASLRMIGLPTVLTLTERLVFSFGLGLSFLSLATLACGLAGWLSRPLLGTLVAAGILSGLIGLLLDRQRDLTHRETGTRQRAADTSLLLRAACLAAIVPFLWITLLGAMLPSIDFDAKAYHLEGAKEFYQNGRIAFLPHNVYTSFPFFTEMLCLLGMVLHDDWFHGALVGQVVLMSFSPLTGLGIYAAGKRWFNTEAGWIGATIFLTTPWIYRINTITGAEGGLTFFLLASLLATGIALQRFAQKESATRTVLLAGLLSGSAMACKYPGVISVIIPLMATTIVGGLFLIRRSLEPVRKQILKLASAAVVFALGVAITVGPWLLKNTIETGNPVYPLMYTIFGGRDIDTQLNDTFRAGHRPDDYDVTKLPGWMFDVSVKNDWLSPLLYAFAPLVLLNLNRSERARRASQGLLIYAAWLFFTWWALTHRLDRFWVPMIPVVALLAGAGATWSQNRIWKLTAGVAVALCVVFNLAFSSSVAAGNNEYLADLNHLRSATSELTNPGIAYINNLPHENIKVLCVGEAQVFDAQFPLVYNTVFDRSIFHQWTAEPDPALPDAKLALQPADQIRAKLREAGITHVLVNWQELLRYRTTYSYTDFVTPRRFQQLVEQGVLEPPVVIRYGDFERLAASQQRQIETWGPELRPDPGDAVFIAIKLYRVAQ